MPKNQFQLFLTEAKTGWLESRIVCDEAHYDLSVSCTFSEPLKDLFTSLCDLHGLDALPSGDTPCHREFEWGGEGWLYEWRITPKPDAMLDLEIEFKGKREVGGIEYPMWKIDTSVPWKALADQVFTQASEMLWMYGFTGYQQRWTKDFPAGNMMRLGHLLHGQSAETHDFSRELGYLAETR